MNCIEIFRQAEKEIAESGKLSLTARRKIWQTMGEIEPRKRDSLCTHIFEAFPYFLLYKFQCLWFYGIISELTDNIEFQTYFNKPAQEL